MPRSFPKSEQRSDEKELSRELIIGMVGWSTEDISADTKGFCYFPTGKEDSRYKGGREWERHSIIASAAISAFNVVIIADDKRRVRPYSSLVSTTPTEAVRVKMTETEVWSNSEQLLKSESKDSGEIVCAGFNKVVGWAFADRACTLSYQVALVSGGTFREVDTMAIPISDGTGFSFEFVGKVAKLVLTEDGAGITTVCEIWAAKSTGA